MGDLYPVGSGPREQESYGGSWPRRSRAPGSRFPSLASAGERRRGHPRRSSAGRARLLDRRADGLGTAGLGAARRESPAPQRAARTAARAAAPRRARGPHSRSRTPSKAPFRTHGKVFFHLPSGDYVCSGTVVRARNKRLVVTAGHCVFGDGDVRRQLDVRPRQGRLERSRSAAGPRSAWPRRAAWQAAEDTPLRRRHGDDAQARTASACRTWSARAASRSTRAGTCHFDAFGYPARPPFNGGQLWRCSSEAQRARTRAPPPAPDRDRLRHDRRLERRRLGHRRSPRELGHLLRLRPALPIGLPPTPTASSSTAPTSARSIHDLYRSQRRKLSAG